MATATEAELNTLVQIARAAGAILLEGWGKRPAVEFKSEDINLVTEFDRRAEALVVEHLTAAFPEDALVAEEGATRQGQSGRVFYVDPLDGTTNFAHGLPLFCVSIGLCQGKDPLLGVVHAPALGWTFAGSVPDGKATFNGQPMAPSPVDRLARALLVTGFPYVRHPDLDNMAEWQAFTAASQGVRRLGSAALDLCFVGCGWLEGYWEGQLKPWDLAGGAAILTASGGRVSDLDGAPFDPESGRVVASNGLLHTSMLAVLQQVRTDRQRRATATMGSVEGEPSPAKGPSR